jgi:hypothetical protein
MDYPRYNNCEERLFQIISSQSPDIVSIGSSALRHRDPARKKVKAEEEARM